MEDKYREKEFAAFAIKLSRGKVGQALSSGIITNADLVWLIKQNASFGITPVATKKHRLLQEIFNAPFLLCDQPSLDGSIKSLLPSMLVARYSHEVDELKCMQEIGYIDKQEEETEIEMLRYVYYETSEEGKAILQKNGQNVQTDVTRRNNVFTLINL